MKIEGDKNNENKDVDREVEIDYGFVRESVPDFSKDKPSQIIKWIQGLPDFARNALVSLVQSRDEEE